jgi:cytoskeleton protein RodZ
MAQIGSMLREARIHMGLSLKSVSEITKVRFKYLEALEEDDFQVIPGPTFIKAYLRTYASVLRLDADALVEEYRNTYERRRSSAGDSLDLTLEQVRNRSLRPRKKRPERNTRRGYTLVGVLAIVAVVLLAWFGSNRGQSEARLGTESTGGSAATTLAGGGGASTTLASATGAATTTSEAVFTGSDVLLSIEATGDCFLIVRRDNKDGDVLYRDTLKTGVKETWTGSKSYWVNIGQPDAVRIFINEVPYLVQGEGGIFMITETTITRAP